MPLKPWYKLVTPREDLREGKPLDASEFAVHLDKVRDGSAPVDYQDPARFFERTYMTKNLISLGSEVLRRLSGEKTETSAIFNMTTQFGGGKTHALTLLFHLASNGAKANDWLGVKALLSKAGINAVPNAATAVFVGTEFDSLTGRGGADGTPLRKTPWGEIAFQLGGKEAFKFVEEHEKKFIAPAGDVIRQFLPKDRPSLILMDEIMNYVSRYRKSGFADQLYDFLQNLSETVRGMDNIVLVISIPKSEVIEMTPDDMTDYERLKHMLNRVGKAMIMSAESEVSEIIRRRLFEWDINSVSPDGKVLLSKESTDVCNEYADWTIQYRNQIPSWFPVEHAREKFSTSYPFHPMLLSVFERKWQALPRFQQTRGILRLLALWVSKAYQEGFKGAHKDSLIGLGTAPLDDPLFRVAVFEQLGESRLEGAVTTDIAGKQESHACQLDKEAIESIKKARLHRKVSTAIFFESNGGTLRSEATVPEIRLAVAEPEMDIGNVETVIETLTTTCYFLSVDRNKYRFGISPNLNKLLSDRRASIQTSEINECVRDEIREVFEEKAQVELVFFPDKSNQISDRPLLTFVVLSPEQALQEDRKVSLFVETMTKEYGTSARTFKNGLVWCVPETSTNLREDARKCLAWQAIEDEAKEINLDDTQLRLLSENLKKSKRDLRESVWRTYKILMLLHKDNSIRTVDLGLPHSSAAASLTTLIVERLRKDGDVETTISPNCILRNWSPAFVEWSTKAVRDAFFASPVFPRLLNPDTNKETIVRGVNSGMLAYVGKKGKSYEPFVYGSGLNATEVEISNDMFIITKETAETYKKALIAQKQSDPVDGPKDKPQVQPVPQPDEKSSVSIASQAKRIVWSGEIPWQKWTNFYTRVLSKFTGGKGIKLTVKVEIEPPEGIQKQKIEETKSGLRELGLGDDVDIG
jgi:hypothetical protein